MFCKECGTENLGTQIECIKCKTITNNHLPLHGLDRTKIIAFFALLILPFMWFGGSVIILLIVIFSIYIMKKNKSFKPIIYAKKLILAYLIILFTVIIVLFGYEKYNKTDWLYATHYKFLEYGKQDFEYKMKSDQQINDDINQAKEIENQAIMMTFVNLLISLPIIVVFLMLIFNNLFFKPLERHRNWIINNGLFADYKDENSFITKMTENVQTIKKEPTNQADELLKWAELKEKGLITDDEFQKAKNKILEGNF